MQQKYKRQPRLGGSFSRFPGIGAATPPRPPSGGRVAIPCLADARSVTVCNRVSLCDAKMAESAQCDRFRAIMQGFVSLNRLKIGEKCLLFSHAAVTWKPLQYRRAGRLFIFRHARPEASHGKPRHDPWPSR